MDAPFSYKTGQYCRSRFTYVQRLPVNEHPRTAFSLPSNFILHCTVKLDTIFMLFTNSYMTIRGDTEDEI